MEQIKITNTISTGIIHLIIDTCNVKDTNSEMYETIVMRKSGAELFCKRTIDPEEARANHAAALAEFAKKFE